MANIALQLGEPGVAERLLRNAIQTGKSETGSIRIFLRVLTERGQNVGKIIGKNIQFANRAATALAALEAVIDLGRYTHRAAWCAELGCSNLRYDRSADHFIDDLLDYWSTPAPPQPPAPSPHIHYLGQELNYGW